MCVQNASLESIESGILRNIGCGKVAAGNDDMVKFFGVLDVFRVILGGHMKHAFVLVVVHVAYR